MILSPLTPRQHEEKRMEIIDKSGQPRSVDELKEALRVVERRIVSPATTMQDPELFLQLPTIRETLLMVIRVMESNKKS